jgi:hypothetical protein
LRTRRRRTDAGDVTRTDVELRAPDNVRLRSKAQLARYCALHNVDPKRFNGITFCNTKRNVVRERLFR